MKKVAVPSQSKQSLENVFEKLQTYIKYNIDKRVNLLFESLGIKSLVNGTNLKVTTLSGTNFNVNPGVGLTNDYELIELTNLTTYDLSNAIDPNTEQVITLSANTYYVIKLFWKTDGSDPVAVANSFNYNAETTLQEEQRWSTYSDSFTISAEVITEGNAPTKLNNELMLAIVRTESSSTNLDTTLASFNTGSEVITAESGIVDIRHLNLLKTGNIKIDDSSSLELSSIIPSGTDLTFKSDDDITIYFKNALDEALMKIDNVNRIVEIGTGDTYNSLKVIGNLNVTGDIKSKGWKVLTEEIYAIKNILNFRVLNISAVFDVDHKDPNIPDGNFTIDKKSKDRLRLNLEWGYNKITGDGSTNGQFTITSGETFQDDELAGYYLWIPGSPGTNYYIAANTGNVLTLHSSYETVADVDGVHVADPNYAWINSNVTSYEIAAVPYTKAGLLDTAEVFEYKINYGQSPVVMNRSLILESGVKYNVKIRGIRNEVIGPWTPLLWSISNPSGASGSYTYLKQTDTYGPNGDIVMEHVTLEDPNATLDVLSTPSGFKLTLTPGTYQDSDPYVGWSYAEEYEFAWSDSGTTINWADPSTYESKITAKYSVSISTYDSIEYNVAVRPLIGRMSVGTPIESKVVSGTGGALPANNIIATTKVELFTFSGTSYTSFTEQDQILEFGSNNIYSPSQSSNQVSYSMLKPGYIVTIQGYDYRLVRLADSTNNIWLIEQVNHTSWPPNSTGIPFEINTSKYGRKVYSTVLHADTQITKLEAVCSIHDGEDITVRVYQNAGDGESLADYVNVVSTAQSSASGQTFSTAGDTLILSSKGIRNLVIDLWDPSTSNNNDGSFVGTINVYGQTYTTTKVD